MLERVWQAGKTAGTNWRDWVMGCVRGENGRWSRTVVCGQVAKRLRCPGGVQVYSASDGALLGIFGVQNVRIRAALQRDA